MSRYFLPTHSMLYLIKSLFEFYDSDRKGYIFQIDKMYFADVASSYIEKIQRSIAGKDTFEGRIIIFKQALTEKLVSFWSQATYSCTCLPHF